MIHKDLLLTNDPLISGFKHPFLFFITLIAILCGILVIINKNPIISVLFLIGLFLSISIYLTMLGLNFIGLSYLLVYVGAVSILFLFILMLINVRISELVTDNSNSIPLATIIGIFFISTFYDISPLNALNNAIIYLNKSLFTKDLFKSEVKETFIDIKSNIDKVFFVTSKSWEAHLTENSHITSIGGVIYTSFFMYLFITAIILLLGMVGAIVITIRKS